MSSHVNFPGLKPKPIQRGFTLVEVLVAFLILSVGLIGLAGLQLTGVKNTREAYHRTQATVLAADIIDRMRANQGGVSAGDYDAKTSGTVTANCLKTTGCTSAQMAAHDVAEWRAAVATSLPGGDGIVCVDSSPFDGNSSADAACQNSGDLSVVKIWWRDPTVAEAEDGTLPLRRLVTVFRP